MHNIRKLVGFGPVFLGSLTRKAERCAPPPPHRSFAAPPFISLSVCAKKRPYQSSLHSLLKQPPREKIGKCFTKLCMSEKSQLGENPQTNKAVFLKRCHNTELPDRVYWAIYMSKLAGSKFCSSPYF
jgi:hypothetical protein